MRGKRIRIDGHNKGLQPCELLRIHLFRPLVQILPAKIVVFLFAHAVVGQNFVVDRIQGLGQGQYAADQIFVVVDAGNDGCADWARESMRRIRFSSSLMPGMMGVRRCMGRRG